MTKTMVIALVILLALLAVAAPASARFAANAKMIQNGDTIYVYETGLNLNNVSAGITRLAHYSDKAAGVTDNIIDIADAASFSVLASDVNGYYDAYYAWNAAGLIAGDPYVLIKNPSLTLDVVLNSSHVDSVNGKSITRSTPIAFKITNNVAAGFLNASALVTGAPTFQIEITTPDGGKVTAFGTPAVALNSFAPTGSQIYSDTYNGGALGAIALTTVSPGTYTAVAKWNSGTDFYKQAADSASASFTIVSKAVSIQSNKESVVRGNNFVVTIQGESNKIYWVYVKDAGVAANEYPFIVASQSGVNSTAAAIAEITETDFAGDAGTGAKVTTTATGTRPVEFNTTSDTKDKAFTIKVVDPLDTSKYDTVRVTVEKGQVTITATGTGTYYLGEEIKLTGTNTDNKTSTHLFLTGPNLNANGVLLTDAGTTGNIAVYGTTKVDVEADNTWEYKWDTSDIANRPDAGTYTIWASSQPVDNTGNPITKSTISDAEYATVSIVFKKPFVTASVSSSTVAKGDEVVISGVAEGKPTNVFLWVFGKNLRDISISESVEADGTYEHTFERGTTSTWASGQYYAVVQHPMENGVQDVFPVALGVNNTIGYSGSTDTVDLGDLQASDAATALIDWINKPQSDDTYTKLTFLVEEPWINIDTVGDKYVGDTFTITGTTNLAEGDTILIEVVSAAFQPTDKSTAGEFSGTTGQVTVVKGATANTWSFEVDAATFKADQYIVNLEWVEGAGTTATTTFNVLERTATPTATATANVTATATTIATTIATTTATPTPTTQPGFGALVALVGLGAVAVLVLRRH